MIEKQVVTDKIEILEDGTIQIREVTRFVEDGVIVGQQNTNRRVIDPGADISKEDKTVSDIVAIVQTPEKIKAFNDKKAKEKVNEKNG